MRVLGIDPSLTSTGLAVVEDGVIDELVRVRPKSKGFARLDVLVGEVTRRASTCDVVGIEGPAFGRQGRGTVDLFGLWGVLTYKLHCIGKDVVVVPPTVRAKYATGRGNAGKDDVLAAVIRRYRDERIAGNDIADALLVAAVTTRSVGHPFEEFLPAVNLSVMGKVEVLS